MTLTNLIFPFDYIFLSIGILTILISTWKGFIKSILGLLTWVGSILISIYLYNPLSIFITNQILNIKFFKDYEYLTNIGSTIIAIPVIFLFSLFILKKIRKFLFSDLDKPIVGIILDKIFGFIYGVFFSYLVLSSLILLIERYELFNDINIWIEKNSYIILKINNFNDYYINYININDNLPN